MCRLRCSAKDCSRHCSVLIGDPDHMRPVGDIADIHPDYAILPGERLDLFVVNSDCSLCAKIPPLNSQAPVLRQCFYFRDERRLHRKLCLFVQVDPAARAAQGRQFFIIIDTCHEFSRALPRRFLQLLVGHRSVLRLICRDHGKASGHCRRRHRRAGKDLITSRVSAFSADSNVVDKQRCIFLHFRLSGIAGEHTDPDPGDHIFPAVMFPFIDTLDHTGISVIPHPRIEKFISLLLRQLPAQQFMRFVRRLYKSLDIETKNSPLALIKRVGRAAAQSLLESAGARNVQFNRLTAFIPAGDRVDRADRFIGVGHRCFDTDPAGILRGRDRDRHVSISVHSSVDAV